MQNGICSKCGRRPFRGRWCDCIRDAVALGEAVADEEAAKSKRSRRRSAARTEAVRMAEGFALLGMAGDQD